MSDKSRLLDKHNRLYDRPLSNGAFL